MTIKELFSDPARHTRFYYAETAENKDCGALAPDAVRWCLAGALTKCYRNDSEREWAEDALRAAAMGIFGTLDFVIINDHKPFEDVMKLVEAAGV
jgi:hypothetical protein